MSNLTIYPTSLALRQRQAHVLEQGGFMDGRDHLSVRMFMDACSRTALSEGLLRTEDGTDLEPLSDLDRDLAMVQATALVRDRLKPDGVLDRLSATALEEVLGRLTAYIDPLADRADAFLQAMESRGGKQGDLACLYQTYDEALCSRGRASACRVNAAILELLRRPRTAWPRFLQRAEQVSFVGLRWVPPFVELAARGLASSLGTANVHLVHILEEHEQAWWGEQIMAQAGALVFGGEEARGDWEAHHAEETTRDIAAFLDRAHDLGAVRDGFAMLDPALAEPARPHMGFSQSVGVYGEIEDLARRLAWHLQEGDCRPDELCLTARNLGDYSDAIADVFTRFGIPYYFRRGIPVMSVAAVKAVLNLATFSAAARRDTLCSLLESPWLDWALLFADTTSEPVTSEQLADDIRRSGVEPEIPSAELLRHRLASWYGIQGIRGGGERAELAVLAYRTAKGGAPEHGTLRELCEELLERCRQLGMEERLRAWAQHESAREGRGASAHLLNARGFRALQDVLKGLISASTTGRDAPAGWTRAQAVISRCARNLTVSDSASTDSGVWVLTPYDLAGLQFKVVLAAGMNSGTFPAVPTQSALLLDDELQELREHLGGDLPRTALAGSAAQASQENLLFLSLMAAAGHALVLSRTSRDADGRDVPASVFYTTLWRLAGWPAHAEELPREPPEAYDRWRLRAARSVFEPQWNAQATCEPHQRQPFLGESFLSSLPLALCRGADEARQSVALGQETGPSDGAPAQSTIADRVRHGLEMERARGRFFDALAEGDDAVADAAAAPCVGHIGEEQARGLAGATGKEIVDFSTTALQDLANCPYRYYLGRIMGLEEVETNELDASPADLGTVVHLVMETGFRLLLGDQKGAEAKTPGVVAATQDLWSGLPAPRSAEKDDDGWVLAGEPKRGSFPVAVLDASREEDYQALFGAVCKLLQELHEQGGEAWKLGPAQQAPIEWQRIRASVHSLLAAQLSIKADHYGKMLGGAARNIVRGTVFVEYVFDSRPRPRYATTVESVEFVDSTSDARLRVHGVVDRVDLLFDETTGRLAGIMVLDYKGSTKDQKRARQLAEDIAAAHDCQLPVYGAVAARAFGAAGAGEVPVICQYLLYRKNPKDGLTAMKNWWIRLDGQPLDQEDLDAICGEGVGLMAAHQVRLFEALNTLRAGAFAVQPDSCDYCPFPSVCRYVQPSLEREET